MKPTKSILDKSFRYTSAMNTDIQKTFARFRWEQQRASMAVPSPAPTPPAEFQPGLRVVK